MKIFKELELLGFFEWLAEMHNLRDTDMKPEYLDELPLNDIHLTVCNSMAFRWFREKYNIDISINTVYSKYNENTSKKYGGVTDNESVFTNVGFYETYEEAELACLQKLIEIVKTTVK